MSHFWRWFMRKGRTGQNLGGSHFSIFQLSHSNCIVMWNIYRPRCQEFRSFHISGPSVTKDDHQGNFGAIPEFRVSCSIKSLVRNEGSWLNDDRPKIQLSLPHIQANDHKSPTPKLTEHWAKSERYVTVTVIHPNGTAKYPWCHDHVMNVLWSRHECPLINFKSKRTNMLLSRPVVWSRRHSHWCLT